MNLAIIRRAVWTVAVAAFGYAMFAYWEWRAIELLIATGVVALCVVTDLILAIEHQARRTSPFGPVQKWGHRRPVRSETVHRPTRAASIVAGGQRPAWRRQPWWRRMYRRLTPWWTQPLLIAAVLTAVALLTTPPASAATSDAPLTTAQFAVVLIVELLAVGCLAVVITESLFRLHDAWRNRR